MKRATTQQEKGSVTFTIIVDDEVSAYIEQQGITDVNAYMVQLLQQAKAQGINGFQNSGTISAAAADTSGYPEMKGHFSDSARTPNS